MCMDLFHLNVFILLILYPLRISFIPYVFEKQFICLNILAYISNNYISIQLLCFICDILTCMLFVYVLTVDGWSMFLKSLTCE